MMFREKKEKAVASAIALLDSMKEGDSVEDKMSDALSKIAMKDSGVDFITKTFKMKYGLDRNVVIAPYVSQGSLRVESWNAYIGDSILFTGSGIDSLLSKLSEAVITTDKTSVDSMLRRVKECIE